MFEDMFIHFDRLYKRDRQTDTQTHTPHDDIGRACTASRSKNAGFSKLMHISCQGQRGETHSGIEESWRHPRDVQNTR